MQFESSRTWDAPLRSKQLKKALFWALLVGMLSNLSICSARLHGRRTDNHHPRMHSDVMLREGQSSQATAKEIEQLLSNIERELKPWAKSGITLEMVERVYCFSTWTASLRLQIKDNKLFVTPPDYAFQSRVRTMLHQLVHLSQKYVLPDIDVVLVTDDFCPSKLIPHKSFDGNYGRCPHLAPIFSISRLPADEEENSHCVQMPDFTFAGWPEQYLPTWRLTKSLLQDAADNQPWESRSDLLFWKGGNTHPERETTVKSQVVQESGMTQVHFVNFSASETFVSLPGHCHHKYLLHMEGYSYSSRLKYLMACGSAILYPNKRYTEFWYHMLDGTNYVPVVRTSPENQGEPILRALKDLKADESRARAIGKAGQHLVMEVLHPDNIDRYWMELILQYSRLMTFEVELHPDVQPIDHVIIAPDSQLHTDNRTCTHC